ncbi:M15 family metallopeptidase [Shewanella livingstonensis]|uniref:D-alanyl-D-alanine carboxypeptidase family protein n=1 Tax=Shewanella livingstonensis TaxID=150120 RepID=A0A3G8LVB3_9GAMM|nr:M15 family metallopeptidase [Shewanella livingstonensis]AZG73586.1 D-alanyl-D-alanine carboxypeptidase family protein [Shewanella livingstonensis]
MQINPQQPIVDIPNEQAQLYGLGDRHLVTIGQYLLEQRTAVAFTQLQNAALVAGFDVQICSAYRPFDRQLSIWNAKASGQRPLLDSTSNPLEFAALTPQKLIDTILIWSALPGASRHHWGTDIDVYDANCINQKKLQLITAEYTNDGPCAPLHQWLGIHAPKFGFYFPYQPHLSGVSPEPWHMSYFPVANQLLAQFSAVELAKVLSAAEISLKSPLLERLTELVNHYVFFVAPSPT